MQSTWTTTPLEDGVLGVRIDRPERSVNSFSKDVLEELDELLNRIEQDRAVRGVLFESSKPETFIAGADLEEISRITDAKAARCFSELGQRIFARLEGLSMPTVALISGSCLGGGLEFALACRYRIADDRPKTLLGLPEVQLGLIPGWGGTVRLPRRVGLMQALRMITAGSSLGARQAKSAGLVDAIVRTEELQTAGKRFLTEPPSPRRRVGLREWLSQNPIGRRILLRGARRMVLSRTHGHYPAPLKAIDVLQAGLLGSAGAGFEAERSAIGELAVHPVTAECIRLFFLREDAKAWAESAAPGCSGVQIQSVGVLGAGAMGAGIARILADRGIQVYLKDVSRELIERGFDNIKKLYNSDLKRKRTTPERAAESILRIHPTTDYDGFGEVDIVIEAVVENLQVKQKVFAELQSVCGPDTALTTNTSSLLVGDIAQKISAPQRLAGLHFFNPPHRMPLVEVVRGEKTNSETLAKALATVRLLGKTPVVVGDCAGFLVNRLLIPSLNEAGFLLVEVSDPMDIERAAVQFGYSMGPLEMISLVGIDVAVKVSEILHAAYGDRMEPAPAWQMLAEKMTSGAGKPFELFERRRRGKRRLSPQAALLLSQVQRNGKPPTISPEEISARLTLPIINEAARCLEEGIATSADQVDLAMVMGTGFAPFRGGPLRYADRIGIAGIVETLDRWASSRPRLAPSEALRRLANEGLSFASRSDG